MCAGTCAGECLCVCWSKSVNIVLCSSNSSSSDSPVAARSTVYFPSWWTTSYQISRHCLLACCPTMRSQRISRPPFSSRLSYSGASAHSWWLTTRWTTHTAVRPCELYQQWLVVSQLTLREGDVPDAVWWADPGLSYAFLQRYPRNHIQSRCDCVFSLFPWQPPQLWQRDKGWWWLPQCGLLWVNMGLESHCRCLKQSCRVSKWLFHKITNM